MPQYDFKNKETGEITEVTLRISEYDDFVANHPELVRYFGASSAMGLISGRRDAYSMAGKDWQDHLKRIKAGSGKDNTIKD
jgi:hypothetical protein